MSRSNLGKVKQKIDQLEREQYKTERRIAQLKSKAANIFLQVEELKKLLQGETHD